MEYPGLSFGRSVGNLRSKLDVRQYALEVALSMPDEDKLKKAAEIEEYLTHEVDVPGYYDPNQSTNDLLKKVTEMTTSKTYVTEKKEGKAEEKTSEEPM